MLAEQFETASVAAFEDADENWNVELYADGALDEALVRKLIRRCGRRGSWRANSSSARSPSATGWHRASLGSSRSMPDAFGARRTRPRQGGARAYPDRDRGCAGVRHRPSRHHARLPHRLRPARPRRGVRTTCSMSAPAPACSPSPPRGCFIAASSQPTSTTSPCLSRATMRGSTMSPRCSTRSMRRCRRA